MDLDLDLDLDRERLRDLEADLVDLDITDGAHLQQLRVIPRLRCVASK